jgi:hypothetical protein
VFDRLLREDVTSTRTSWTDWRRKWKKDRRFYGWGRDDREREKRFREWLKELGESELLLVRRYLNYLTLTIASALQRNVLRRKKRRPISLRC